jgi:hypothetical protein
MESMGSMESRESIDPRGINEINDSIPSMGFFSFFIRWRVYHGF